jgi:ethanolamine ammonia-lyase small subunit
MSNSPPPIAHYISVARTSGGAFRLRASIVERLLHGCDVAIVAADGLSSSAIAGGLLATLESLRPCLQRRRLNIGPLVLVEQGRVAIGDEIGELLNAKLALVLIGERPGLSACDSLGAYITWRPRVGTMDSARNCISNIRAAGLPPRDAANQIDELIAWAFAHSATGVRLNDLRDHAGDRAGIEIR